MYSTVVPATFSLPVVFSQNGTAMTNRRCSGTRKLQQQNIFDDIKNNIIVFTALSVALHSAFISLLVYFLPSCLRNHPIQNHPKVGSGSKQQSHVLEHSESTWRHPPHYSFHVAKTRSLQQSLTSTPSLPLLASVLQQAKQPTTFIQQNHCFSDSPDIFGSIHLAPFSKTRSQPPQPCELGLFQ